MRTIKFRAWSLKDKCYLNSFAIFYNGDFADMAKGVMHNNICQCDINYQKHLMILSLNNSQAYLTRMVWRFMRETNCQ